MSWQPYIDDQLLATQMIKKACIIGFPDGGVWAQSPGFGVGSPAARSVPLCR